MVPTSWRVREGGGAMALMPRCYAAGSALVRTGRSILVSRFSGGCTLAQKLGCTFAYSELHRYILFK